MKEKIFIDDYRISFVFGQQDPFVEDDLRSLLEKRGFKATGPRVINAPPFRAVRADIAKKGDVSVLYDNETSFVGVAGRSLKEVRRNFDVLGKLLRKLDRIMFNKQKYVELVLRSRVWTKKDPQKAIIDFLGMNGAEPFKNLFEKDVRPFGVRIVTEDLTIMDNPNWFELRIEPLIRNPRYYFIQLIYRNENGTKTLNIADRTEEIVFQAIKIVEKRSDGSK